MKTPEEYLRDAVRLFIIENYHNNVDVEDKLKKYTSLLEESSYIVDEIRHAQEEAYNQALEDAVENAVAKEDPNDFGTGEIWVDDQSILKLKIK